MDAQDKQPRVINPSESKVRRKRFLLYVVGVILVLVVIVILGSLVQNKLKTDRSKQLIANINQLSNHEYCVDGLKNVSSIAPKLINSNQYTTSARERALEYLMVCTKIAGDSGKALTYANQLETLYNADANRQKQQEVTDYINYIKNQKQ